MFDFLLFNFPTCVLHMNMRRECVQYVLKKYNRSVFIKKIKDIKIMKSYFDELWFSFSKEMLLLNMNLN